MLGVFSKWDGKSPIDPATVPLLYEDMDKVSADLMQELDDEIQAIKVNLISFETHLSFFLLCECIHDECVLRI